MGSEQSRSNTHVANATGSTIRVFYNVDTLVLTEMVVTIGATVGNEGSSVGGSVSTGQKMTFKRDSRIRYVRIPVNDFCKISGEGTIYVSVFVENSCNSDECAKTICLNFKVPSDRSIIVAKDCNIRFQKYAQSIWMDEYGTMHNK